VANLTKGPPMLDVAVDQMRLMKQGISRYIGILLLQGILRLASLAQDDSYRVFSRGSSGTREITFFEERA